ncbi:MAG: SPOR domain-containing protein [Candidatus Dactylopiibacterium sp.]|nr:SPOR domain-containing protein [Candidatus Dactylopiibacterium sp.]
MPAENDVQTDLKKRARRRLVGALALVLVAAIVLPMVMDSEPRPGGNELSIRIPSQEDNLASQLIKGNAPPPAAPALPADAPDEIDPPSPDDMASAASASAVPSAPAVVAAPRAASSSASSASSRQSSSVRHPEREAQRARDILEGRGEAPATAAKPLAGGQVYVQLGVYKDAANARETAAKAAAAGVKVNLENMGDGRTRVRTAPVADRAAADKLVEKLRKAGLSAFASAK